MPNDERPLPKPPSTPFGRRKFSETPDGTPLMADRIAAAMAEGRMEEFLSKEIPDNEHARALVSLMMGMSGMAMPDGFVPQAAAQTAEPPAQEAGPAAPVPDDVVTAVEGADVGALKEMLQREFEKRSGSVQETQIPPQDAQQLPPLETKEKEVMDQLIAIAADNRVSIDWLVLRALRVYVEDYGKHGRL